MSFLNAAGVPQTSGQGDPGTSLAAVVPSDATVLVGVRAIYVGGAGNIAILADGDSTAVTLSGVGAGTILPIAAKKVMATNTTATLIVAIK